MDIISKWQYALTFLLSVTPWLLPNLGVHYKIIVVLSLLLISSILFCFRLTKKIRTMQKQLDETNAKHNAVALRFDKKRKALEEYRTSFLSIEYLLTSTIQSSNKRKLEILYEYFLKIKLKLTTDL